MDPMGEVLYVSDTSSRRVYRVRNLGQPKDPSRNLEVVAGTGEQCLPFDQSHCGEGRKATEAALNNPRGKTLSLTMFSLIDWDRPLLPRLFLLHCYGQICVGVKVKGNQCNGAIYFCHLNLFLRNTGKPLRNPRVHTIQQ